MLRYTKAEMPALLLCRAPAFVSHERLFRRDSRGFELCNDEVAPTVAWLRSKFGLVCPGHRGVGQRFSSKILIDRVQLERQSFALLQCSRQKNYFKRQALPI